MRKIILLAMCIAAALQLYAQSSIEQIAGTVAEYANTLTLDKLKKATSIAHYYGNGSVAPEYHYTCYITVTPDEANVTIYHGYDGTTVYDQSASLSRDEYIQFIKHLAGQKIRKIVPEMPIPLGLGASVIEVKVGDKAIFSGDEQEDVSVGDGSLIDAFLPLLPDDMRQAVLDPESYINTF